MTDASVIHDREFGLAAPALGWVPAPRFLLRRAVVLRALQDAPPGRVLEIGAGAGTLWGDLTPRGFTADAVETSAEARDLAARMLSGVKGVSVRDAIPTEAAAYDYLFAFEVLEHIADDTAALSSWLRHVRPGGRVMLSVPAYAKRWTATDTWAGHVRRYDRADFIALAERCGLRVTRCIHYGFPLADLIEPINARAHARALKREASRDERTAASGVRRTSEVRLFPLLQSWPGRVAMRTAVWLQRRFEQSSLGNGLLLEATLP